MNQELVLHSIPNNISNSSNTADQREDNQSEDKKSTEETILSISKNNNLENLLIKALLELPYRLSYDDNQTNNSVKSNNDLISFNNENLLNTK